ncbi:substrate-binding domain-containing protein [Kitasatospora viridis]|uniref:Extracellular solute-binding protein n=1 Tax=Kitasatospora viridis TaxID=281105 RepID=A0A561UMG2_9ACTN|nr:substrate-binding domain-containing protein [Kitasatospora viridis]TWG00540.1 extracellular solute-binding protein [Kitasatospora viridis]
MRRQLMGIGIALALVAAVVVVVVAKVCCGSTPPLTRVHGLIGSEKGAFFADQRVKDAFAKLGLAVDTDTAGSWQMPDMVKGGHYDFAMPASSVAAKSIPTTIGGIQAEPFYSPLVVVTTSDVADFLRQNGLAEPQPDGSWIFRMRQYLTDVRGGTTWAQLPQGKRPGDLAGDIYIDTTNPSSSSSGAFYLAVMSYLANGERVVATKQDVQGVTPLVRQLTQEQGAQPDSSDPLFQHFTAHFGLPLVWTYESEAAAQALNGTLDPNAVILYPDYDIQTNHTVVELTPVADRVAKALQGDPALVALEAQFGFRPATAPGLLATDLRHRSAQDHRFPADLSSLQVIQPPSPTTSILHCLSATATSTDATAPADSECPQ